MRQPTNAFKDSLTLKKQAILLALIYLSHTASGEPASITDCLNFSSSERSSCIFSFATREGAGSCLELPDDVRTYCLYLIAGATGNTSICSAADFGGRKEACERYVSDAASVKATLATSTTIVYTSTSSTIRTVFLPPPVTTLVTVNVVNQLPPLLTTVKAAEKTKQEKEASADETRYLIAGLIAACAIIIVLKGFKRIRNLRK